MTKFTSTADQLSLDDLDEKLWNDADRFRADYDLVGCMVALPGQPFYSTQIPVCPWFLAKNKAATKRNELADKQPRRETAAFCPVAKCRSNYSWGKQLRFQ